MAGCGSIGSTRKDERNLTIPLIFAFTVSKSLGASVWALQDLNLRPMDYESTALTN
jgi:hypothetical protein